MTPHEPPNRRAVELRDALGILSEDDLADLLNVTIGTLQTWRSAKQGPLPTKLGNKVFYRMVDVSNWING